MADLIWGEPVIGGETVPGDRTAWLYKINDDGTRRSIRYRPESGSTLGFSVRHDGIVLRRVGWVHSSQAAAQRGPFLRGLWKPA